MQGELELDRDLEPDEAFAPVDDVELDRAGAERLYPTPSLPMVHPERWARIRETIRFEDVVALFQPVTGLVISCPFHGTDSRPSFYIYRSTNVAFCFGCEKGHQYYDHVRFVAAKLVCQPIEALRWIEKRFSLPPIADLDAAGGPEEEQVTLTFLDLRDHYIRHAAAKVREAKNARSPALVSLALEYLEILFTSWPTRRELASDPNAGDPLPLARVLGRETIHQFLHNKGLSITEGVLRG